MASKTTPVVNNAATLKLVREIDEHGTRLSKGQINFIAAIIDEKQVVFSPEEAKRVARLHEKKVVNGKPEVD